MAEEIGAPEQKREIRVDIPEHQILLSFTSDSDAVLFYEWWNKKGLALFLKWAVLAANKKQ